MQIDAHQHFWKYDPNIHGWINKEMQAIRKDFLPRDLRPLLQANNIEGCVAVQVDQTEDENLYLLALAKQFDFIKGVVGWIDLKSPKLRSRLQYFSSFKKLKGFRHIVQGEPAGFLRDKNFIAGVKTLAEFGFTYDLLIYHHQLEDALAFLPHVRDVKIVIDHIAKPSIRTKEKTHWELNMAAAATFENVHCKVSGMVTEADWSAWTPEDFYPYLDELMETFGPSRLMYGSDWPVCLVAAEYDEQISIVKSYIEKLSGPEQELIMGENAWQFYNL